MSYPPSNLFNAPFFGEWKVPRLADFKVIKAFEGLKNPEGFELAQNGRQHDSQVAKTVTINDANFVLSPRFRHVPIELSL
ncbi:hypothetical protein TNCV_2867471 [Trichonephila clavipes]|nr:hypothetical protein TNCV_2867471 [Trichonephila clavipes]